MNRKTISAHIRESFNDGTVEKALTTDSGSALMTESLEGKEKILKGEGALEGVICVIEDERGQLLGGTSLHDDERKGKVVFVGGGMDEGEDFLETATRELKEESGVSGVKFLKRVGIAELPNHLFVYGKTKNQAPNPNEEFEDMKWYSKSDFYKSTIPSNQKVLRMLNLIDTEE